MVKEPTLSFVNGKLKWRKPVVTHDNKYSEWRVLTPMLLAIIVVAGGTISYLAIDKLNSMNDKSDKLFGIVGEVRASFQNYQIETGAHFARIDQELMDFKPRP